MLVEFVVLAHGLAQYIVFTHGFGDCTSFWHNPWFFLNVLEIEHVFAHGFLPSKVLEMPFLD